ncbi:type II secretion system protein J [Candidatus Riflebacteria bacterium]
MKKLLKKSFTLTEIMITVVVMSLIFVPMIGFWTKTQRTFQKGAQIQDSLLGAAALMKQLKLDLRASAAAGSNKLLIDVEKSGAVTKMSLPIFTGDRDKKGRPRLALVTYRVKIQSYGDKLGEKKKVIRSIKYKWKSKRNRTYTVAKNILAFKVFQYYMLKRFLYFRIAVTGYSSKEIVGGEATVQLYGSVASRYFSSAKFDPYWRIVDVNRPTMK